MLNQIDLDINGALKRGDHITTDALRFLKSSIINAQIAARHDLSDEEILRVIRKEIKSRIEARDIYAEHGRRELAAKEESERSIYAVYVPDELDPQKLNALVIKAAKDIEGDVTFNKLMPITIQLVAGQSDGKTVVEAVKKYLEQGEK
ncbi:MAG TPA: GatB/YqeY domain-containing protein [Patescibacteria group bacterium]|jgi:hypothetical protein|nr:GatB/YqeY domain-containing protein [Patescibacteria group bacterium]